jgi:hypothetical protein
MSDLKRNILDVLINGQKYAFFTIPPVLTIGICFFLNSSATKGPLPHIDPNPFISRAIWKYLRFFSTPECSKAKHAKKWITNIMNDCVVEHNNNLFHNNEHRLWTISHDMEVKKRHKSICCSCMLFTLQISIKFLWVHITNPLRLREMTINVEIKGRK